MRRFPIDTSSLRCVVADKAAAKTDNEGTQKTDRDGNPLDTVAVLVKSPGERSSVITVTVPAGSAAKLDELTPVTFENLTGQHWAMNGRSGVSFSATAVKPAAAAAAK